MRQIRRKVRRSLTSARRLARTAGRRASRVVVTARGVSARRAVQRRAESVRDAVRALPATGIAGHPEAERRRIAVVIEGAATGPPGVERADQVISTTVAPGRSASPGDGTATASDGRSRAATLDHAVRRADADLVCLVAATAEPVDPSWLDRLCDGLGDAAAAAPLLLHPPRPGWRATPHDALVREAGLAVTAPGGAPSARSRAPGTTPRLTTAPEVVDATSGGVLLVERAAYLDAGGLPDVDDLDAAMVELTIRLRRSGRDVVVVPAAPVYDHRPVRSAEDLRTPLAPDAPAWRALVDRIGPLLVPRDDKRSWRITITTSVPSPAIAARWGDWHLAEGLAGALRDLGHEVQVCCIDDAESLRSRASDLHLVLRGQAPVRRTPGQRHVVWVISHPDDLSLEECDDADVVLVASEAFAAQLSTRTSTPVAPLLQATDPRRFQPRPPDPAWAYPVAIVANARHARRHVVDDALAAGIRPAIIGRGWRGLVDPRLIVAEHVPNAELATVYSSVGVLLNDHWPDMAARGFVSNRVFDVLACDAPLVSDPVAGLDALFGDAVPTYDSPAELRTLVDGALADPRGARRRAAAGGRVVRTAHTFAQRARELLRAVEEHTG